MRLSHLIKRFLILALLMKSGCGQAADAPLSEYKLKAAFIYHFSQFVEWPADTFTESEAPFVIGVLGENPFGADLDAIIPGKKIGSHPLVIRMFRSASEATSNCRILFISSSEQKQLPQILAGLGKAGILTVGDSENFSEAGGIIQFVMEGTKIRFRINESPAQQARLKVSAKLLSLALHGSS